MSKHYEILQAARDGVILKQEEREEIIDGKRRTIRYDTPMTNREVRDILSEYEDKKDDISYQKLENYLGLGLGFAGMLGNIMKNNLNKDNSKKGYISFVSIGTMIIGSLGLLEGVVKSSDRIKRLEPVILDRTQAYIGVLIDDIVIKGTNEPYRMMTSRAEYRLLLRQDNADLRLLEIGHRVGLISEERYQAFLHKKAQIEAEVERLHQTVVRPTKEVNEFLRQKGTSELTTGSKMDELLKRTEIRYQDLAQIDEQMPELPIEVAEEVEIQVKYEGYIKLQESQVEKFKKLEQKKLPQDIDYEQIKGLRLEARQKLNKIKPESVGQASRISGVSPADISVLLIFLEQNKRGEK